MTSTSGTPAIAVHGGAFDIAPPDRGRHREGGVGAARAGWQVLEDGGSALDAVERAVRELEQSGIFGAGRGSALSEEGFIELDAGMMDGARLQVGSVTSVRGVPHAITLARLVLDSPFALFCCVGVRQFSTRCVVQTCET